MGEWVSTILTDREDTINHKPWNKINKHYYSLLSPKLIFIAIHYHFMKTSSIILIPITIVIYFLSNLLSIEYWPFNKHWKSPTCTKKEK